MPNCRQGSKAQPLGPVRPGTGYTVARRKFVLGFSFNEWWAFGRYAASSEKLHISGARWNVPFLRLW